MAYKIYNFSLALVLIIAIYNGSENGLLGIFILGAAIMLPVLVALKEMFNEQENYLEEGMLPNLIDGFRNKKGTRRKSRLMFYSYLLWIFIGAVLIFISRI